MFEEYNSILLKNCKYVIVNEDTVLENVDILIEDGKITNINKEIDCKSDITINCENYIISPSFVNAHTHSPMIIFRGELENLEFHDWLKKAWEKERQITREEVRKGAEISTLEMLNLGIGCVVDTYLYYEEIVNVRKNLGPITFTGPGVRKFPFEEDIKNLEFINKFDNKFVFPIISIHSLYNIEDIKLIKELDETLPENLPFTIHLAETRREVYEIKQKYGQFPIEVLYYNNLLNKRKWIIVHGGWITSREIEILRKVKNKVLIVNCSTSNMKLATYGFLPIKELLNNGIYVALGTDSPASNNSFDMLQEAKIALLLHRHNYWEVFLNEKDMFRMLTRTFYEFLGLNFGEIKPGYFANLVFINYRSPGFYPLDKNKIITHLIFSASSAYVEKLIIYSRIFFF